MSWLFSRALVAAFSAGTCSDGEPSAPLSVMPTPHKFWRNGKTMDTCDLSQFGLTCAVLTAGRGAELLTSFQAAFPAKTSAAPEPAPVSTGSAAACGPKWPGLLATFDPASCSWRTAQSSLLGGSDEFSETWPRSGMTRDGRSYLRPKSELPTFASASGLWQTPVTDDAIERKAGKWNSRGEPKLSAEVKLWPTPVASDQGQRKAKYAQGGTALSLAVTQRWPTPMANDAEKRGAARVGACLPGAVEQSNEDGLLNPYWVEWLMGWPIGWTALEPLETARFREWQQSHGLASLNPDSERAA